MDFQKSPFVSVYEPTSLIDLLSIIDGSDAIEDKRLIQAVLGLLMGNTSNMFVLKDEQIEPSKLVRCHNLSLLCSQSFLLKVTKFGNYINFLNHFFINCLENEEIHNLTLLSYAFTLRDILHHSVYKILLIEHDNKTITPLQLLDYLESEESGFVLEKIKLFYEITKMIEENKHKETCSTYIIDNLYNYLSLDQMYNSNVIIDLFLSSIKPSMTYIENLLTKGEEDDMNNEFFFKLNCEVEIDDFWDKCLQTKNQIPTFFLSSIEKLYIGIKSRLIIKKFDSQKLFKEVNFPNESFFDIFKQYLLGFLQLPQNLKEHEQQNDTLTNCLKVRLSDDILKEKIITLKHKHLDLSHLCIKATDDFNFLQTPDLLLSSFLSLSRNEIGMPIQLALQKSYALSLKKFCTPIDSWLVNYAQETYLQHLQLLNDYFFFQRPTAQLLDYFYAMFTDITVASNACLISLFWQNYYFSDHKIHAFLSHLDLNDQKLTSLVILANIHLIYDDLGWISLSIIDMASREVYDSTFQLLVKLKYNKWILENLKYFKSNWKNNKKQHKLFLARHRLLFIANNMFHFVVNNIHKTMIVLNQDNKLALNYKDLRKSYQKFIQKIKCITFQSQSENSRIVLKLISTLCKLGLKLYEIWNDKDFTKANQFLAENDLDNFEKALKLFLFRCDMDDDVISV